MLDLSAARGRELCGFKALCKDIGDAELGSCIEPVPSIAGADTSETTHILAYRTRVMRR